MKPEDMEAEAAAFEVESEEKAPSAPAVVTEAAEEPEFDLESLLGEYDDNVGNKEPEAEDVGDGDGEADDAVVGDGEGNNPQLLALSKIVGEIQDERLQAIEAHDTAHAIGLAEERLEGLTAPEGYGGMWLRNEYQTNPQFQRAWDARYANEDAMRYCEQMVARSIERMADSVQKMPDRAATEDRTAIADAVRGASSRRTDRGDDVDRDRVLAMGDGEFEDYVAKLGRG